MPASRVAAKDSRRRRVVLRVRSRLGRIYVQQRIRSILIVGGGTAGWLAATYLNRALGDSVVISLVESSDIGRIGVGEATIPTLRFTMNFLGLKEEEWMPRCGATFKTGVKFVNWQGKGESFYHPFHERPEAFINPYGAPYYPVLGDGFSLMHFWLAKKLRGETVEPFAYAVSPGPTICDLRKSPRFQDNPRYEVPSAYHLDAAWVAAYLREIGTGRGVKHVVDDVENVELDARGFIARVHTKRSGALEADLFLDCSGFRGLLVNQALKEEFVSDRPSLLCDSAVAMPARSNGERDGIAPYTMATALGSGWVWDIPLFNRRGCGYVYSSQFLTKEQAESELRQFLGPSAEGMPPHHIAIRTGQNRRIWVNNCVSIGLSSCFIEPLESTGIFLVEFELAMLLTFFPDLSFDPVRRDGFNRAVRTLFEETRDFVLMHYVLSRREDTPFWRAVKNETFVTEALKRKLESFRAHFPLLDGFDYAVFRARNYASILAGMDCLPQGPYPIVEHLDPKLGDAALAAVKTRTRELVDNLPSHYEYLCKLYGHPPAPFEP
ncbi:MAG TPA: tryptophan halogenase family protein [Polyangiaceae bacterium]|nr:tryptophan halogenase family protein [Polyangiaceae bacterium]